MSSIVPNIAYPSTNKNTNSLVAPLWKKPGPIKHYRKQLQPERYSNSNRTTINRISNTIVVVYIKNLIHVLMMHLYKL